MPLQKEAGHREPLAEFARGRRNCWFALPDKGRQAQQLVAPGPSGFLGDRAPGLRRYIDQVIGRAGCGAALEIKPEAELGQELQLEANDISSGPSRIEQMVKNVGERRMNERMRITLGQQPAKRSQMGDAVERM